MKRSFIILNLVWVVVVVGVAYTVRVATKESYFKVGYNDGSIDARYRLILKLEELKRLPTCDKPYEKMEHFFDLKASSIFFVDVSSKESPLCIVP